MPSDARREHYFTAAIEILAEQGFRGLKMTTLHRRLGVTSGSFYHFFRSWPDFVAQFLAYWTEIYTDEAVAEALPARDPLDRLAGMRARARVVPHDAEAAIRTWSTVDSQVERFQREVDRRRIELIRLAVVDATGREDDADRLAALGLAMIVGLQQLTRPVDVDAIDWALARFIDLVTGSGPADPA